MIPPDTLERIRAASDIVEVIGSYLPLKKAGANFTALCPFHKEKSPSFNVSAHKQIFYCFGCHKGGDVFKFVQEYENLAFMDAVRRLAERAKIPLEFDVTPGQQQTRHLKDTLLQIHEQLTQRWQTSLTNDAAGQIARDYLAKRGVSAEAVKLFRLGYAPDLWDDTVNWARSKGHDWPLVEQAGLIIKRDGSEGYYDRFRGRLMFPICDEQGRVIGFSGRVLTGDEKTAKYVNSPETPLFTKGKVIFGLDKSKRALLEAQRAIICEGQLDLIACFMGGVQNVVAPQGTALTADHTRLLKRYVEEVVLCFDSDNAGQNAAVRSLDILLASGLAIRVATVPAPHDPDSYIKEFGGPAFQQLIESAEGFFDFYLGRLCAQQDIRSDRGRAAVLQEMGEAVQKTGDAVLADTYAQRTAARLGVSPGAVREQFKKIARQQAPVRAHDEEPPLMEENETSAAAPRPSQLEFWFLKILLNHDELLEWLAHHLHTDWLGHETVRHITEHRLTVHQEERWQGVAPFLSELESDEARSLVTEAITEDRPIPEPAVQLAALVKRLRNEFIDRQIIDLGQSLDRPGITAEEHIELLRQRSQLQLWKRQPLTDGG